MTILSLFCSATGIQRQLMLVAILLCSLVAGQAATILWDANPETNVLGYRLYWGAQSRSYAPYANIFDVGNVTNLVLLESTGRVFYAVTAYDEQLLESEYSDEVFYDWPIIAVPPSRPTNLRITGTNAVAQIRLQQRDDLSNSSWRETGVAFVPVTNTAFFRAARPLPAPPTPKPTAGSKVGKFK